LLPIPIFCLPSIYEITFSFNHYICSIADSIDEGIVVHDTSASIQGLGGPMTRARTKKAKETLTQLVAKVLEFKPTLESTEGKMVMCIKPLEEGWGASFAAQFI